MHVRRPSGGWRRAAIASGLFALSMLAPTIWREVRPIRQGAKGPDCDEGQRTLDKRSGLDRLDAYVPPDLPADDDSAAASWSDLAPAKFAGRFGQLFAPRDAADSGLDDEPAFPVQDVPPPSLAEDERQAVAAPRELSEPAEIGPRRDVVPEALLSQLEPLASQPLCQAWVARTTQLIQAYAEAGTDTAAEAIVQELKAQVDALDELLGQAGEVPLAVPLRRARHALARRVDVWTAGHAVLTQQAGGGAVSTAEAAPASALADLAAAINEAEQFLSVSPHRRLWVEFLMLAELRDALGSQAIDTAAVDSDEAGSSPTTLRSVAARGVELARPVPELVRVAAARHQPREATLRQRRYLRRAPLMQLRNALLRLIDEPVDVNRLLGTLENYETAVLPSDAEEIAGAIARLSRSGQADQRQLGERLAWHYRGANLRIALSEELLTRLLPKPSEPAPQEVSDTILGIPVTGQSLTYNTLRVRLPQSHGDAARVLLQAEGTVASDTWARSGPVITSSHTDGQYRISKAIDIEPGGIVAQPARVEMVQADSQLQTMQTEWDGVPLIGGLVRSMAVQRYESTEAARREEVERKMAARVHSQFEQQAEPLLARLDEVFVRRVLEPLARLRLQPEAVLERPADGRLNVRIRLAGEHQLSGHTPRPRALAGGLASLQIHESLVNNLLEQLRLNGRTMTAAELVAHVNRRINLAIPCKSEKAHMLTFTFADRDALRVRLADDELLLVVSLAGLEAGDRSWSNFQIVVPYAVKPHGATVQVVQTDEPRLIGRLSNRSQIILHGILTNFFDSEVQFPVLAGVLDDERFGDVQARQVVIADGWLGVSLMAATR